MGEGGAKTLELLLCAYFPNLFSIIHCKVGGNVASYEFARMRNVFKYF